MIDPLSATLDAVAHGNLARFPVVVLAGAATSIGPCVAPRYVALAAILDGRRRGLTIAAFIGGMLLAYAALGFGVGVLGAITGRASVLDAALAVVLAGAGFRTLLQPPACAHDAHAETARVPRLSGAFSLGAASALVISPCCTPVVAAVAGFAAFDGNPLARAALLVAFALGHAAPLLLAAPAGALGARTFRAWSAGAAPAVVSGTLMLALGLYYGLLV